MKYLLVSALIALVFWLWRRSRRAEKNAGAPPQAPPGAGHKTGRGVTETVACRVCQVHLPRSEALIGRDNGVYCSQAHRREAEG